MTAEQAVGFRLADVFARSPYEGNGAAVFVNPPRLTGEQLLAVTNEVRQFESVFLWSTSTARSFDARVFVAEGEVPFAGHPTLAAAAVLHDEADAGGQLDWVIRYGTRSVEVVSTRRAERAFDVSMEQGAPTFEAPADDIAARVAAAFGITTADLDPSLPLQTVSTGLPYLMVPVRSGVLERARVVPGSLEPIVTSVGASFAYLLDVAVGEARNWDNDGVLEDIATGSAAGPAAAYLVRWGRARVHEPLEILQGRFAGRPSTMTVEVHGHADDITNVRLSGEVHIVGTGTLHAVPGEGQK